MRLASIQGGISICYPDNAFERISVYIFFLISQILIFFHLLKFVHI